MFFSATTEKVQIGSRVEIKIDDQSQAYLMVDEEDPSEAQQLSCASPLGRQLMGRHRAENFHCRVVDGKIVPVKIEHIEKIIY